MMKICRLVCLPPFSALPRHEVSMFPPIQSVANQSGDAKSCVSQARMSNKLRWSIPVIAALFARETQDFASLLYIDCE